MQYNAPSGSLDPDAPYVNGMPGQVKGSPVNAHAVEYPQREILNVIKAAGLTPTNNELDQLLQAIKDIIARAIPIVPKEYDISMTLDYFLCIKIFKFIHPTAKPGVVPVNGTLITDAATRYPQAFAYLQSAEGQQLCTTEALWQAANVAVWATLADGRQVGWDGIGGVCKYVIDTNAGTIRVPDLRGMTDEVAGVDSLGVGGVDGDRVKDFHGNFAAVNYHLFQNVTGMFQGTDGGNVVPSSNTYGVGYSNVQMLASRVLPVGNKTAPRRWGALACVYLGRPTS